jgi:hypothetical protein
MMMWAREGHLEGDGPFHFESGAAMSTDEYVAYPEEGEDDPEYPRTSAAERWRVVCGGILSGLMVLVLMFAFFAAIAGLAEHLGGPVE